MDVVADIMFTVFFAILGVFCLSGTIYLIVLIIKSKKPTPEEYAQMEKERKENLAKMPLYKPKEDDDDWFYG